MNFSLVTLELGVVALAVVVLLLDLWTEPRHKARLGCVTMAGLFVILGFSFAISPVGPATVDSMLVQDGLALYFQRFFLVAAIFVLFVTRQCADRMPTGLGEFH